MNSIFLIIVLKRENVDPEIKSLMLFLIEALRATLPVGNAINQRSVNTLLKNHFRDIMDLATKIRYVRAEELPQTHKGEITLTLESIEIKDSPMYIVIEGTATVWRLRHLHQHSKHTEPPEKQLSSTSLA